MTWNYRIVQIDSDFGIYEVYYDDEGNPMARTEDPVGCVGGDLKELRRSFDYMEHAFKLPVLRENDFW